MSYVIRPARRGEAKPLIGIYGESGSGKTLGAVLIARGFVGPTGRIVMIETEAGRGEVFCDDPRVPGGYEVLPLRGSFSPENYGTAITDVEQTSPPAAALIIDSASHEWEGVGGVLAMAAKNQADGMKGPLVWQGPKLAHSRHFMLRLMATPIPLVIVCMRAKYPMVQEKGEWKRSEKLEPKQADDILFEMMIHGWIDAQHKFRGTKYTRDDLKPVIPDGEMISLATGERLAAWAKAGSAPKTQEPVRPPAAAGPGAVQRGPGVPDEAKGGSGTPPASTTAPATDRGAGDHNKAQKAPIEAREGLFPTAKELKPETRTAPPAGIPVAGLDVDDESQAIVKLIDEAKAKLERQPTDGQWKTLCKSVAGTEVLDMADPAALSDLLTLVKQLVEKGPAAIAKARGILKPAETKVAESTA